jgi:hypothetical protein
MKATRTNWKNEPMPLQKVITDFSKQISVDELNEIVNGLIPYQMEDKWFIFSENNTIYFHRSWTGTCVYHAEFNKIDSGLYNIFKLTINRNPEQYKGLDIEYDKKLFEFLVDRLLLNKNVEFPVQDSTISNEDKMIRRHSSVGYGTSRKEMNK